MAQGTVRALLAHPLRAVGLVQITQYGMSTTVGPLVYRLPRSANEGRKRFSNATATRIDAEVPSIKGREARERERDVTADGLRRRALVLTAVLCVYCVCIVCVLCVCCV
jgi:hypothetical protein